jgi:flavin-dependent dehydrogenase
VTIVLDCIVIGGSLSGSSLALLLGRAGFRVLITEKGNFPKSKPCGEGLSATGLEIAQHLNILPERHLPYHSFTGFTLYAGRYTGTISHPYSSGISVERSHLDSDLWGIVSNTPGVEARERCRVTDVWKEQNNHFKVTIAGERTPISAKAVVVAAGGTSSILKKVSRIIRLPRSFRVGISGHYTGNITPLMGKVHIFLSQRIEFYVTPLSENKVNIAVLADSENSVRLKELLLRAIRELQGRFGVILKEDNRSKSQGRTHLGNILRSGREKGIFLVGDAIEQFDPIGGMGMTHAFFSAGIASEYLAKGILGHVPMPDAVALYEQNRTPFAHSLRTFTSFTALAMKLMAKYPPSVYLASSTLGKNIAARMSPKYTMSGINDLVAPNELITKHATFGEQR